VNQVPVGGHFVYLDMYLIVVSVVGFQYMFMSSMLCRVISRSRKLMVLFSSYVGVNVRFGFIVFIW